MFSLNAPVPGAVRGLIDELRPSLSAFEQRRERPSILVKRLGDGEAPVLRERLRRVLSGAPAIEARIDGIGCFDDPPTDPAPVVYLAVESPGLRRLHRRLCEPFDPVEGIEGDGYVPHVTLARGDGRDAADRLLDRDVESVSWTISELHLEDATYEDPVHRFSLPA